MYIISKPSVNSNLSYSPKTLNSGQNRRFVVSCALAIWWMTLKNNRTPLPSNIKLIESFHHDMWIQTGVAVRKRLSWVLISWPWHLTLNFCMDITFVNGNELWKFRDDMMTGTLWKSRNRQTHRRTDWSVPGAAWLQCKTSCSVQLAVLLLTWSLGQRLKIGVTPLFYSWPYKPILHWRNQADIFANTMQCYPGQWMSNRFYGKSDIHHCALTIQRASYAGWLSLLTVGLYSHISHQVVISWSMSKP